jgi:hypothetical protein
MLRMIETLVKFQILRQIRNRRLKLLQRQCLSSACRHLDPLVLVRFHVLLVQPWVGLFRHQPGLHRLDQVVTVRKLAQLTRPLHRNHQLADHYHRVVLPPQRK